jgi:hypothetical protein
MSDDITNPTPQPSDAATSSGSQILQNLRAKFPGSYDDLSDDVLAQKLVARHPEYADAFPAAQPSQGPTPSKSDLSGALWDPDKTATYNLPSAMTGLVTGIPKAVSGIKDLVTHPVQSWSQDVQARKQIAQQAKGEGPGSSRFIHRVEAAVPFMGPQAFQQEQQYQQGYQQGDITQALKGSAEAAGGMAATDIALGAGGRIGDTSAKGARMVDRSLGITPADYLSKEPVTIGGVKVNPADLPEISQFARDYNLAPTAKGTALERLGTMMDNVRAGKSAALEDATSAGQKLNVIKKPSAYSQRLEQQLGPGMQVNPDSTVSDIRASRKEFINSLTDPDAPPDQAFRAKQLQDILGEEAPEDIQVGPRSLTPIEAENLKEGTYARVGERGYMAEKTSANIAHQKQLARGIKDVINEGIPGIEEANRFLATGSKVEPLLYNEIKRIQQEGWLGGRSAHTYVGTTGGQPHVGVFLTPASIVQHMLNKYGIRAKLGMMLAKNRGIGLPQANAIIQDFSDSLAGAGSAEQTTKQALRYGTLPDGRRIAVQYQDQGESKP